MSRYRIAVNTVSVWAVVLGLISTWVPKSASGEASRPNILYITVDDLNDWVGCLGGHPQVQTPNIDRLSERGVLFTNAHCVVPACSGSRAANWTGLSPVNNGVYGNGQRIERTMPGALFLPKDLANQGYRTYGTGKLFHGNNEGKFDEYGPTYNKWWPITDEEKMIPQSSIEAGGPFVEHFIPRLGITMPLNRMPRDRNKGSNVIESFDWGVIDRPDREFTDTLCANYAIRKLGETQDRPFFLGVGFYRPHQPLWVPKRFHDLYPPESVTLPPVYQGDLDDLSEIARDFGLYAVTSGTHRNVVEHGEWRNAVSAYLASISFTDAQLGRILDALDASPYAENTMIVLWSDHGFQLGEKEHWGKFTAWERSTRVPLIIVPPRNAWPNGFRPGTRVSSPVSLLDVYPTVVEMLGVQKRDDLDGRSLVPLLRHPHASWPYPAVTAVGRGTWSIRDARWRYIRYFDGSEELYDLENDPDEWRNLVEDPEYADVVNRLSGTVPNDDAYKHFVRYGEFKAVIPQDGSPMLLYGPGEEIIYENDDVSDEYPDVVRAVQAYLRSHGPLPKNIMIER